MGFLDRLNDVDERDSLFNSNSPHGFDASDAYANLNKLFIEFYHLPSDKSVAFKAYLTDWNDKFDSKYNSEDVYGRNDQIHTFQGTTREISISWVVPAASAGEAMENLARTSLLAQFQYPAYKMETFTFTPGSQPLKVGTIRNLPLKGLPTWVRGWKKP